MKKTAYVCSIILVTSVLALSILPSVTAKPSVSLPKRTTWDIDMIDSDITGYTGRNVYVAVLDTGLVPNWRDYFPADRIATNLGKGFYEPVRVDAKTGELVYAGFVVETSFIGSTLSTHGTHVVSTIIGYNYYAPSDAVSGYPLPPIFVEGVAPDVTIIPVKVLSAYHLPGYSGPYGVEFGTDLAVAAGIHYATELKLKGYSPMIISMSLGGDEPSDIIEDAVDYAIANGVIVVASAGNDGEAGMGWPGAYPQVISVGACGWKYEWYSPTAAPPPRYRLWWLQDSTYGYRDISEPTPSDDVYVTDWSSRENDDRVPGYDQDLDVLAPGSWVRGPFPGYPGYSHLPWWSQGRGWMNKPSLTNFYYAGGTSMAAPHVTSVVAMMLEKNPNLTQAEVEEILESTALPIPEGSMTIYDISPTPGWYTYSWGANATGSGLIQAKAAVQAVPEP